jgi:glucosamine 6-phosphate synthetase-like amidotransferase/phosphosugar isomerase protein
MSVLVLSNATSYNLFVFSGDVTFSQVVNEVMRQLEGAYALIFKSPHYPNELIACKRGSTLILGVNVRKNIPAPFFFPICFAYLKKVIWYSVHTLVIYGMF